MKKRRSFTPLSLFAGAVVLAIGASDTIVADSVSPDKQWQYECKDGIWSSLLKTDSGKMMLDLSNAVEVPYCHNAEVLWSPDSKRFAFNYTPPHAPHTTYQTIMIFELRNNEWVALPGLVDEASSVSQMVQLAKEKNLRPKNAELLRDVLKVRRWVDPNTVIFYAYSRWTGKGSHDARAAFLFTVLLDAQGNSKIVKTERVPEKQIED